MIEPARRWARTYFAAAGVLLLAALAGALLPTRLRLGTWVPFHLGFTGAAVLGVTGAAVFFVATLRRAPLPHRPLPHVLWHIAAVGGLIGGRIAGSVRIVEAAGGAFVLSVVWIGGMLVRQAVTSEARRYPGQVAAPLVALASLVAGAVIGALFATGRAPTGAYTAHIALNLLGFFGILVTGTLPRFLPMVVRVRMRPGPFTELPWIGLSVATALVALGAVSDADALMAVGFWGGSLAAIGSLGVAVDDVRRSRAEAAPDGVSIAAASAWLALGWTLPAVGGTTVLPRVVPALVAGFLAQVFVGAWSYFVPALQPGSSSQRRAARRRVGASWVVRVLLLNAGASLLLLWPEHPEAGWAATAIALVWFAGTALATVRSSQG